MKHELTTTFTSNPVTTFDVGVFILQSNKNQSKQQQRKNAEDGFFFCLMEKKYTIINADSPNGIDGKCIVIETVIGEQRKCCHHNSTICTQKTAEFNVTNSIGFVTGECVRCKAEHSTRVECDNCCIVYFHICI